MTTITENLKLLNNKASICTKHFSDKERIDAFDLLRCVYCGELF